MLHGKMEELGRSKRFEEKEIHNKINTLKKKGRELYQKHRLPTATGSSLDANKFDLTEAHRAWKNFETYHALFFTNPQWGPGKCQASLAMDSSSAGETADQNNKGKLHSRSKDIAHVKTLFIALH